MCYLNCSETFSTLEQSMDVYVNFPLESIHPSARKAAEAAECAGRQGRYWDMHDLLFQHQIGMSRGEFLRFAGQLSLDHRQFSSCLDGEAKQLIERHIELGRALGVNSTPVFFAGALRVDGSVALKTKMSGALPYATIKTALKELLD